MNKNDYSRPLSLNSIHIQDDFWSREIELVRTEVIPYQWQALNDNIPEANPSFCMHNFKAAARLNEKKSREGHSFKPPVYTYRGFEALPEDMNNPDPDTFYGFVFQDTDFSKWIEAVGYSLIQHPDDELERIADGAIDIVCAAQQEDGYLDTYYIINGRDKQFTNLRDHHELYCFGHLVEGAVAYYQATGKDKLLNAAKRFADYIYKMFGTGEGQINGYPGHEIAEMALIRLYEVTGEKRYFDLAKYFVDERGKRPYYYDKEDHPEVVIKGHEDEERYSYQQAHKPVRQQQEAVGHAVRAVYLYSGMADIARIGQDEELLAACQALWDSIVNRKMYITGGIGATHLGEAFSFDYDLPNDTAYAETCASIGMAFFARRMLEIEPKSEYADIIETEMYNGILSGMALDGKSFFYVNPLEVNPVACEKDERKRHVKPVRQKWFGCACCPPNLARFISSIGSYAFTENDSTLFVHQYIGCDINKGETEGNANADLMNGVGSCRKFSSVHIDSQMPWSGKVAIKVKGADSDFILALRIPGWCQGKYSLEGFNGQVEEKNGYLYLRANWETETVINLDFDMKAEFIKSCELVRENYGKVSVKRGPVVYCLEQADNGEALHRCKVDSSSDIEEEAFSIQGYDARKLIAKGYRFNALNAGGLYSNCNDATTKATVTDVKLAFIPYFMWANRGLNEMQVWVGEC